MTELRNTWALREVYFDEHGNPSMHREPVPMTDEQIRSMCKQGWVFEPVKQWVSVIEAHHGITAQAKKERA